MSWNGVWISLNFAYCFSTFVILSQGQDCRHPLGLQNKTAIPDSYLTATSIHAPGTGPQYARLHSEEGDGAWCPKDSVKPGTQSKYLQIQLPYAAFITRVATQGRYGKGRGREFVRNYMVNYSRDGVEWFGWSNHKGVRILQGNSDVDSVKLQSFYPGIAGAKFVRIIPVTSRKMPVCLRTELYGCTWQTGLMSYSIPKPDHPASALHMFSDDTYDGVRSSDFFTGGLGQLTDRVIGYGDVTETRSRYPTNATGYDYVGWQYKKGKTVSMKFRFDQVRNFTSLRVYCNTNTAVGASLFSSIKVSSSLDGGTFSEVENRMMSQTSLSYFTTRAIYVPLRNQYARALKLEFELGKGRLLISEVKFNNKILPPELLSRLSIQHPWIGEESRVTITPTSNNPEESFVTIIVAVLVGVIFILLLLALTMYFKQRKLHKPLSFSSSFTFRSGSSRCDDTVVLTPHLPLPPSVPILDSKLPTPIYHEIAPSSSTNPYLEPIRASGRSPPPPYQATPEPSQSDNRKPLQASHYAETDVFLNNFSSQGLQGMSGNNIYAVPCVTPSPRPSERRSRKPPTNPMLPNLHGTCRDMDDLFENEDERSALLANFGVRSSDLPPEFPRKKLEFVETIGEGQFGEVQLCMADSSMRQYCDEDWFSLPGNSRGKLLVAVKVLHEDATESVKENFFQEVRVMSRLLHGNIVRLLAVCTEEEPFAMITEYMERGDLHQYLRTFSDDVKPTPGKKFIKSEILLKMTTQIASGMKYLASLSFVHRDLAARNCLVGSGDEIRIGDFGMSRNMYQRDYYRIQGRAILPIRWMSWECVLMGLFSSASDVWSFGVTVWEIYSFCKHQPFAALADQQVIENMHHMFRRSKEEVYLPRPKRFPGSLYNVIRKCWRRDAGERPTFEQLHSYLEERLHSSRTSPKPKRPKERPPKPKIRSPKPIV